ncbi:type II secretion system protein [Candidatus Omnitrophota bacterium]
MSSFKGVGRNHGFTLIEIMVVVGVIVVLMVLAMPSMIRSRLNANESSAITVCRQVSNACQFYYSNVSPHTYPSGFQELANANPQYLDDTFDTVRPEKHGYRFTYTREDSENFSIIGEPASEGRTGVRYFYVDEVGVITNKAGEQAGPNDDPVSG